MLATYKCMDTSRQSTLGLIGMCLAALVLSWVTCFTIWLLIFVLLYCIACVYQY